MKKQPDGSQARLAAARTLVSVLGQGHAAEEDDFTRQLQDSRDQAFTRHLVFGVLRWLSALQWLAGSLLNKPLKPRDRDVECLILIGLFQLWQDGTPAHAAVHATAEAARSGGKVWAAGLVNAVLRNFQRRQAALLAELAKLPQRHAHPGWLLEALQADWPAQWPDIVAANNRQPPLWLRVNARRCDTDRYLQMLAAAGLNGTPCVEAPQALQVTPAVPVTQLPGFAEGLVSVQDAAAQLAADYLEPGQGQRVLDACAAPGGKTCHLLERGWDIELTALDRDPERTALIEASLRRLGLQARVLQADASDPESWWDGQPYDRILLDAPCSATGVIRRHPEIKWLRGPAQVAAAVERQRALLDALWPLLKPGGMLVYATCSVLKIENSQQIAAFLSRHGDAVTVAAGGWADTGEPGRQILPGEQDMDGFYYARLGKPA